MLFRPERALPLTEGLLEGHRHGSHQWSAATVKGNLHPLAPGAGTQPPAGRSWNHNLVWKWYDGRLKGCSGTHTSLWMLPAGIGTRDSENWRHRSFQWPQWPAQAVPTLKKKASRTVLLCNSSLPSESAFTLVTFKWALPSGDLPENNSKAKREAGKWAVITSFLFFYAPVAICRKHRGFFFFFCTV